MTRRIKFVGLAIVCAVLGLFAWGAGSYYFFVVKPLVQETVQAAEHGDPEKQVLLGVLYQTGAGFPALMPNEALAAMWFRKAAQQGNAEGEAQLAGAYAFGKGVSPSDAQAVVWYRKAAEHGNAGAQNMLGYFFSKGLAVPQDYTQAVAWYRKAADQGDAHAEAGLGGLYANGKGVSQDDVQAITWYRKAAEQGDADGQYRLGEMYATVRGVPQDDAEAYKWYALAASRASRADQSAYATAPGALAKRMTSAQIADGHQRAEKWQKSFAAAKNSSPTR